MTSLLSLLPQTGHDQLWLLLAAERMLHGPAPHLNPYGPTCFESNPPLAIWLSASVVALAHLLHLSLTLSFKLAIIVIASASAMASGKFLLGSRSSQNSGNSGVSPTRHNSGEARISIFTFPSPDLYALALAFILIFGAIPARDFGQRDHLLILLILPYLITAAIPLRGILPRTLVTLTAALGLALKPHQALIPVAVELFIIFARSLGVPHSSQSHRDEWDPANRTRLLEPALFLLAALTYLAAILLFAPTYLTQVLPLLRDTYWAIGNLTLPQLARAAIELLILAAVSLYICRRPTHPVIPILLIAATAATAAYFLQGTGWYYQQLPAISLFALALTLQLLHKPLTLTTSHLSLTTLITLLALTLTTYFSEFHQTPRGIEQAQLTPDPTFFAALSPGAAVATLTTSVDDSVPPAFRYHLTLAQRYPHLWMLPAVLRNESGPTPEHPIQPARLAELDRLQHQFMVEDLTRWRPLLILVERCEEPAVHCQVLEDRHDNLLAFFLRDPAFAQIFAHYHLLRTSGPYAAYVLSERQ